VFGACWDLFFFYKFHKEECSPNFSQTRVSQATKELDNEASKETENNCEKGQRNIREAKEVTTKQEQESMWSLKPEDSTQPICMRCI
jgi:hypothetical protein